MKSSETCAAPPLQGLRAKQRTTPSKVEVKIGEEHSFQRLHKCMGAGRVRR